MWIIVSLYKIQINNGLKLIKKCFENVIVYSKYSNILIFLKVSSRYIPVNNIFKLQQAY